jgi:hypothetical protein
MACSLFGSSSLVSLVRQMFLGGQFENDRAVWVEEPLDDYSLRLGLGHCRKVVFEIVGAVDQPERLSGVLRANRSSRPRADMTAPQDEPRCRKADDQIACDRPFAPAGSTACAIPAHLIR